MTDDELRALLGNEQNLNNPLSDPDQPTEPAPFTEPEAIPDPFAMPASQPVPEPADAVRETDGSAAAAVQKPNRHAFLYLLLTILVIGVLAFAVFCVIWDVRRGTSSGGYRAGNIVRVELVQHRRNDPADTEADENGKYTFEGIAQNVMPSIVEIYAYKDSSLSGAGSGIILSEDGYIATNAHVVKNSTAYAVRLYGDTSGESQYSAVLVGHDTKTDLAVLKISAANLKPAKLGNSDDVHLGEEVCALGNPAGLSCSITTGIISGVNRKVRAESTNFDMDCIQTDAAISPGNSGGALVDMYGQVIGITSSKYGASIIFGGSYEGLGFAITINQALPILQELMEKGYISGRFRIGINVLEHADALAQARNAGKDLPSELNERGVQVTRILADSDLQNTPLRVNDWILTMNGVDVTDYDSIMYEALKGKTGGDSVHCRCGHIEDDGTLSTFEIDFTLLEDQSGEY